jgi:hypothetical protein
MVATHHSEEKNRSPECANRGACSLTSRPLAGGLRLRAVRVQKTRKRKASHFAGSRGGVSTAVRACKTRKRKASHFASWAWCANELTFNALDADCMAESQTERARATACLTQIGCALAPARGTGIGVEWPLMANSRPEKKPQGKGVSSRICAAEALHALRLR